MKRTTQQNKAMHKYFTLLAEELNNAGLDMKHTLKPEVEIPWTPEMVKRHLWKPIQRIVTEKEHTADLASGEPNRVYEVLDKHISEKFGIHVEFPHEED